MKFGRYLKEQAIVEWRRAYINYRILKKLIQKAKAELDRLDAGLSLSDAEEEITQEIYTSRTDAHAHTHDVSGADELHHVTTHEENEDILERQITEFSRQGVESDDEIPSDEAVRSVRTVDSTAPLKGQYNTFGTTAPSRSPGRGPSPLGRLFGFGSSSREREGEREHLTPPQVVEVAPEEPRHLRLPNGAIPTSPTSHTVEGGASTLPHAFRAGDSAPGGPGTPFSSGFSRFGTKKVDTFLENLGTPGPLSGSKWRPGFSKDMSLAEIEAAVPPACQRFLIALDRECEKIEAFYVEREKEAAAQFETLTKQWSLLADHKRQYKATQFDPPRILKPIVNVGATTAFVRRRGANNSEGRAASGDRGSADKNTAETHPADGNSSVTQPAVPPTDASLNPIEKLIRFGKPEDYKSARAKLKVATFEYYRSLGLLRSYRILNRTGFAKALKKFEKATRIPCSKAFTAEKLDPTHFVSSDTLDELLKQTEDAFARVFEHGDRKRALNRLRDFGSHQMHHFTSWRSGVLLGAALPLLIQGLVRAGETSTHQNIPYWLALLQLFGALFLPVLFGLLFYANMLAWDYARINYTLIFDLDIRTRLDIHQFIELPSLVFFIFSLFFWLAFSDFWPTHISPSAYPLAFLVTVIALFLLPLPVLYPSARWWLVRSLCRVATAGALSVEFRDFFLGDEIVSLYYTVYNMGFLVCTYNHHWPPDAYAVCSTNATWASPVLACIPGLIRLLQSVRRYVDSDGSAIHALNAGKYSAGVLQIFFYFNWRIHGSQRDWTMVLWIFFSVVNSVYTSTWDIVMDWSLGRLDQSKHFFLRSELAFKENVPVYYFAILSNLVLRFSWLMYVGGTQPTPALTGYIVSVMELVRRIQWNTFRVESEHIGNVDGYRVTRNVPLPYVTASGAKSDGTASPSLSRQSSRDFNEDIEPEQSRTEKLRRMWSVVRTATAFKMNAIPAADSGATGDPSDVERGPTTPNQKRRKSILQSKNDLDSSEDDDVEEEDEEDINHQYFSLDTPRKDTVNAPRASSSHFS